jgi:hypothetical protein
MPPLRVALAIAVVALTFGFASLAGAAPGDYRLMTGTIVWPADVTVERVIVIQGDDGVTHFAELAPAETFPRARVGDRVSIIGREGFQPTQILFAQLGHREDAPPPGALPLAVALAPATDVRESPDLVIGTVDSVSGRTLRLTNRHGHRIDVDVAAIDLGLRQDLRPGDAVTIFAPTRISGLPVAAGILVDHAASPSALPRQ